MQLLQRAALLCLSASLPLLSSDAIVLVHNSQTPALTEGEAKAVTATQKS